MAEERTLSSWPEKTAGIVCDEKGSIPIFKELLRAKSWQLASNACTLPELLNLRQENKVGCFIIVDSPTSPATETLRVLFKNPRARLTPTIVVCSNSNNTDLIIYEKIYQVIPCPKPLTGNNFNAAFARMLSLWEQAPMAALRKLASVPDENNYQQKMDILYRLMSSAHALPIALSAMTQMMLSRQEFKDAEAKLLEQCKIHSKNPALLAFCGWFYLATKMPHQAVRFLEKIKAMAPTSTLLNLDLAAGYLSAGDISQALNVLHEWSKRNPGNAHIEDFIIRLVIADGRADSNEKFGVSKASLQRQLNLWAALENPQSDLKVAPLTEQTAS